MGNRFTDKAEKALNSAVKCAEAFGHSYIGSEHILLSLCQISDSVASVILSKYSITSEKIKKAIKEYSGTGLKSTLTPKDMTPCSKKIIENAYRISARYNAEKIGTEHILLAILEEKDAVAIKVLKYIDADVALISDEITSLLRCADKNHTQGKSFKENASPLRAYGKNLCELARQGRLEPVIGRDKETERLIRILTRKNKNNPCLIGEAGVGKTAIIEGLARRIVEGNVPSMLIGKEIICVDLTSMVSGTKYRGDFEERIKSVINEASNNKSIILFIDEIHTIVGAGAAEGAIDAANILKPQLSRGELQLIGATTFREYHKYIEKDPALERRFQPITVNETSISETEEIIYGIRERYESHHNVKITDNAIRACVEYSNRYIQDRFLPDKAIDVLDEACAKKNVVKKDNSVINADLRIKIEQIIKDKDIAIQNCDFVLAKNLHELELKYEKDLSVDLMSHEDIIPTVDEYDIKEIIHEITGIPIVGIGGEINKNELISKLNSVVIGQENVVEKLASAIVRSECGISDPDRPKGFYLLVGSSGVGKTELSKAIADSLFFDKSSFIKLDMSEYSEGNSVTKLIGSPPGYVGHETGGILTEKIRRHPYSILLLDEIEKAHTEVLDLFLQIADNGRLTDSSGRQINFKNTYIVMTSNIGANYSFQGGVGFVSDKNDIQNRVIDALTKRFRTEFVNRIDEILIFNPINKSAMIEICKNKLNKLAERCEELGIRLEYSDEIYEYIAKKAINNKFGVRNLLRIINQEVEAVISIFIMNNKNIRGKTLLLSLNEEKITIAEKENLISIN